MAVHEIVQNIIEEFELAQKEIEAVRNERPTNLHISASEAQAEERLIDALREGYVNIDRERNRLIKSDPGFKQTDGALREYLDKQLRNFKINFKTQILAKVDPPTPATNQRFEIKDLEEWYFIIVKTTIKVVNSLVNLYQRQHQRIPISRSKQEKREVDWTAWNNGTWYKGEVDDVSKATPSRNGHGSCIYPDGKRYDGEWKDDKRNGLGVLTWDIRIGRRFLGSGGPCLKNFNYYEGDWQDDERSGYGVLCERGIGKYMGSWKNDKREGFGIYEWETPVIDGKSPTYERKWHRDQKNGYGKFDSRNGAKFEGTWLDDLPFTGQATKAGGNAVMVDKGRIPGGRDFLKPWIYSSWRVFVGDYESFVGLW